MTGDRVLLVDDEEEFIEMLAKRMKARGIRVETAESGEVAIEKVRAGDFDAIVLDLAMPGLDGMETFQEISKINPDLQVIFLTGHGTIQTAFQAMKLGAADFLEKPASFQELLEKIKTASHKKALLVEKRTEEHVAEILQKKSW
jgi:DNA-binding NtrC family response regulator